MVDCESDLAAYCLDRAVQTFGMAVQEAVDAATEGKKPGPAKAAAHNAVALWTGGQMKFANPTPTR